MPNYRNVYEKDQPDEKARKDGWARTYNYRRQIDEDRIDPCRGNVIKANTYVIQKPEDSGTSTSYEENVNKILEGFDFGNQNSVDQLAQQERILQQFREKNNNQTRVEKIISDSER